MFSHKAHDAANKISRRLGGRRLLRRPIKHNSAVTVTRVQPATASLGAS